MIAKFSNADDLMAHYATLRARLHGPAPKPFVFVPVDPPPPPEPDPDPIPRVVMMPPAAVKPESIRINFEEVVGLVCQHLGYERREIFAARRVHKLCFDRQLLWALASTHCPHMSLPQIGRASGGRDHTTVLHGRKKGVRHPEYEMLNRTLYTLYNEKIQANVALMEQDQNRLAFLPMPV